MASSLGFGRTGPPVRPRGVMDQWHDERGGPHGPRGNTRGRAARDQSRASMAAARAVRDLVGIAHTVHGDQESLLAEPPHRRQRLGRVDVQALAHGGLGVVVTLHDLSPALGADAGRGGLVTSERVGGTAVRADPTGGDALDHDLLGHLEVERQVDAVGTDERDQVLGLLLGPGEPVEQPTGRGVRLREPLRDDAQHDLVAHELARVHDRLGLEPELGALLDRGAQHVAGGDVRHAVALGQAHRLGALARTLPSEHEEADRPLLGRSSVRFHDVLPCR